MPTTTTARRDFLDAWQQHDRAAERFSDARGKGATTNTLKSVTERLVETRTAYANELHMSAVHFGDALQAWRRAGMNHQQALDAVEAGLATR